MHWMLWDWFDIAVGACLWPMSISLRSYWITTVILVPSIILFVCFNFQISIGLNWSYLWLQLWTSLIPVKKALGSKGWPRCFSWIPCYLANEQSFFLFWIVLLQAGHGCVLVHANYGYPFVKGAMTRPNLC